MTDAHRSERPIHTGVDVGGTFTDVAVWDGSLLVTQKVPTTVDQADGVLEGVALAAPAGPGSLLHGTTVATNALLERAGARTALVTDAGFEDLVEIGRQDRPSLYDLHQVRPAPLVERQWRFGIDGRSGPHGGGTMDRSSLADVVDQVARASPEAVAVSLLYSFLDRGREDLVAAAIKERLPEVALSTSSSVVPEFREFERTSTTILNAYLMPSVARYLRSLAERTEGAGVHGDISVMRSSGGLVPLESAALLPASILLSGPAGGVIAATALGAALGHDRLVSFDMGGTSTDVCRIDGGRPEIAYERAVGGLPCRMPAVAIHTVGAGGGSTGWLDPGGALRVGPRSAGAVPGPACYGRGGVSPAVTDANLAIGRLRVTAPLGGSLTLDGEASIDALARLGEALGFGAIEVALGMVEVVEEHMERALRHVSIEEGADPRDAVLVAFGGAGGLHATALARRLDMAGVVIPAHAGVFSAFGLLLAPPRADVARGLIIAAGATLDPAVADVMSAARGALVDAGAVTVECRVDVRYLGQSHETAVGYSVGEGWDVLADRFHRSHHVRNGFSRPDDPIEVVAVRAEATGTPVLRWDEVPLAVPQGDPQLGDRSIMVAEGTQTAGGWWRPALRPGDEIVGPAVIEEPESTTYLASGERAIVHASGALEVSW